MNFSKVIVEKPFSFELNTKYKVWWIPNMPRKSFEINTNSLYDCYLILEMLTASDNNQFYDLNDNLYLHIIRNKYTEYKKQNAIKNIHCNAGGVTIRTSEEEKEEYGEDYIDFNHDGLSFDEYIRELTEDGLDIKTELGKYEKI